MANLNLHFALLNLLLCSFLHFFSPPHDFAMAIFAFSIEENRVQLKIKLDKGDINEVLKIEILKEGLSKKVSDYVSRNLMLIINNQPAEYEFKAIKNNKEFYLLETAFILFKSPITNLELNNTCLIETVDKHSNIIYIKQKGKEMRGFRMNKNRTKILVDL